MQRTLDPAQLGDHIDRLYRAETAFFNGANIAERFVLSANGRGSPRTRSG
jgi:hypothetical protein